MANQWHIQLREERDWRLREEWGDDQLPFHEPVMRPMAWVKALLARWF